MSAAVRPRWRRWALVPLVGMLLLACTDSPAPSPTPVVEEPAEDDAPAPTGARVGVVLPPSNQFDPRVLDAMERDVQLVQTMGGQHIRSIRVVKPDEDVFVGDVVDLLARDELDLTCALTTGASSAVRAAFENAPHQHFCLLVTTELDTDEPPQLAVSVLRTAELGYVLGALAAAASEAGTIAVLLSPHDLERGRLRDGALAAIGDSAQVIERAVDDDPLEVIDEAIAQGADIALVGSGPLAEQVAERALAAGMRVIAPQVIAQSLDTDGIIATWRVQWHRILRGPVDRLLEREEAVPLSVGLAEDAFVISAGAAMSPALDSVFQFVVSGILRGDIDPRSTDADSQVAAGSSALTSMPRTMPDMDD